MSDHKIITASDKYCAAKDAVDTARARRSELYDEAEETLDFSTADEFRGEDLFKAMDSALGHADTLLALLGFGDTDTGASTLTALVGFEKIFDDLATDLGRHVLCPPVNTIAAMYAEQGNIEAAQAWLNSHYDDCDDVEPHPTYDAGLERRPNGHERG
ncbi:hypothetical protein NQK81_01285 [Amycolatopsis roodepoortensis]|uniref:hypothetical protein n=1 Tax=Amycolatopsis roodepoortensis TaxID=700274 RepID=UPI00214BD3B3|nr:hypothetical protein [Amycolatopsis roodepoortensis]UUV32108.1 hypothetical protein NQK81_01285 [Amycolatopsis roodepoortensis]